MTYRLRRVLPALGVAFLVLLGAALWSRSADAQDTAPEPPPAPMPTKDRATLYDFSIERVPPIIGYSEIPDTAVRVDGLPVVSFGGIDPTAIRAIVGAQSPGFDPKGYSYVYVADCRMPFVVCGDAKWLTDQWARLTGRRVAPITYTVKK